MKIAEKYEVPDICPPGCEFKDDFMKYGQNAICGRCPIFCCQEPKNEEEKDFLPLVPAKEFRPDWAAEWEVFFKAGKRPRLPLFPPSESHV